MNFIFIIVFIIIILFSITTITNNFNTNNNNSNTLRSAKFKVLDSDEFSRSIEDRIEINSNNNNNNNNNNSISNVREPKVIFGTFNGSNDNLIVFSNLIMQNIKAKNHLILETDIPDSVTDKYGVKFNLIGSETTNVKDIMEDINANTDKLQILWGCHVVDNNNEKYISNESLDALMQGDELMGKELHSRAQNNIFNSPSICGGWRSVISQYKVGSRGKQQILGDPNLLNIPSHSSQYSMRDNYKPSLESNLFYRALAGSTHALNYVSWIVFAIDNNNNNNEDDGTSDDTWVELSKFIYFCIDRGYNIIILTIVPDDYIVTENDTSTKLPLITDSWDKEAWKDVGKIRVSDYWNCVSNVKLVVTNQYDSALYSIQKQVPTLFMPRNIKDFELISAMKIYKQCIPWKLINTNDLQERLMYMEARKRTIRESSFTKIKETRNQFNDTIHTFVKSLGVDVNTDIMNEVQIVWGIKNERKKRTIGLILK